MRASIPIPLIGIGSSMTRLFIATLALFSLIGPLAAAAVMVVGDYEHCDMKSMRDMDMADTSVSDDPDCCRDGCSMPTCCRLLADLRLVAQFIVGTPVSMHSADGFTALPDAPRAAHTWGIERPPKV